MSEKVGEAVGEFKGSPLRDGILRLLIKANRVILVSRIHTGPTYPTVSLFIHDPFGSLGLAADYVKTLQALEFFNICGIV